MRISRRRLIKRRVNPERKSGVDGGNKVAKTVENLTQTMFFKGAIIGGVSGAAIGILAKRKILLLTIVGFVAGGLVGTNLSRIIMDKESNKTQFKKTI